MHRFAVGVVAALLVAACGGDKSDKDVDSGMVAASDASSGGDAGAGPVTLSEGFTVLTYTGVTTGAVPMAPCEGSFPATPNVQMVLPANFTALGVRVEGDPGLTLHVTFGRNNFCGRDEPAGDIVARGAWSAGTYDIFVGTPTAGVATPFTLRFIEDP